MLRGLIFPEACRLNRTNCLLLLALVPSQLGSPVQLFLLHLPLSWASPKFIPLSLSYPPLHSLPIFSSAYLLLFPTFILLTHLPTYSSSLLITCPIHLIESH